MLDIKRFYLTLRKHGKKSQERLNLQQKFKAEKNPLYNEYLHGYARGLAEAYVNVAQWVKQFQKEDKNELR